MKLAVSLSSPPYVFRACPTNTEYHVFVRNFVANFVENGRKPTKFPTKFWENGFRGQALS